MVYLNGDEQRMLEGEQGDAVQKAMELLVKVAEAHHAEKMIDITHAYVAFHIDRVSKEIDSFGDKIFQLIRDATVKVPTANLPLLIDPSHTKELGFRQLEIENAQKLMEMYHRAGVIPAYTCSPHFAYNLRKGEHVAFTESNVVMLANSWFGVMTNHEGFTTSWASAITGKTPEYGLHLQENRRGQVLIEVDPDLEPEKFDYADYVALASWTGTVLLDRVAVYSGLYPKIQAGHAKYMCASQIYGSPAAIFHIIGVTPEAPTPEAAFGGKKPEEKFIYGRKERKKTYERFCSATDTNVDMICIGCPDCSLQEIQEIAKLLKGRQVKKGVRLWIATSQHIHGLAKRMSLIEIIEGAGGLVLSDICVRSLVLPPAAERFGIRVVASTSGSIAGNVYRRSKGRSTAWFGTTNDCINAAVTGRWEGK